MDEFKTRGILAAIYSRKELKSLFQNYLLVLCLLEGFLFFGCFVTYLAGDATEFPWKLYLFAAFSAPVALTLVFGLTLKVFDAHFSPPCAQESVTSLSAGSRLDMLYGLTRQVPLLLWLFLLLVSTGLLYKMDDIAHYLVQTGEAAARTLLMALGALSGAAMLLAVLWLVLNYLLRRRKMEQNHLYRMEVLQRTGMVLLEDGASSEPSSSSGQTAPMLIDKNSPDEKFPILPRFGR